MLSEKAILACLDHPFIVKLSGTFQDERFLHMVLEYVVGGEFFTHLRKAGRFDNNTAKFYASQIVMIFEYLHNQDFIYRDLKPENLLLDHEGYIKITGTHAVARYLVSVRHVPPPSRISSYPFSRFIFLHRFWIRKARRFQDLHSMRNP